MNAIYDVNVTREDIASGIRRNGTYCAVSTALARLIPDALYFSVAAQDIRFRLDGNRFLYSTPPQVAKYIVDFDAGRDIKPFKFRLSAPLITPLEARMARRKEVRVPTRAPRKHIRARSFGQRVLVANHLSA